MSVKDHVISRDGVQLHASGSLLLDGQVLEWLSNHPHPGHASAGSIGNPILKSAQSELVLDELSMPEMSDDAMHGVNIATREGVTVARVAWMQPAAVDNMNNLPVGTTQNLVEELRAWALEQEGDKNTTTIQPAAGQYISLGHGILPGKQRESVVLDGKPTNIPFTRAPAGRSEAVEPILSGLNAHVAKCMATVFPDMKSWCVADGAESNQELWTQVCQYPRAPTGGLTFPSQQVVVRGHCSHDLPGASAADLHVDKMDGGGLFGGTIMFLGGHEQHPAQWRKFAIFEGAKGGRGVSVPVMHSDCICVLSCSYQRHLHGTVLEEQLEEEAHAKASPCPRVEGLHVVSYNLRMIEGFVERISRESAERQAMVASQYLDERLRNRARAWTRRQNLALEENRADPLLLPAPTVSSSGEEALSSKDAVPASLISTHSQGGAVAYWLLRCATCKLNNEVGIPLGKEVHEFAVRCHACRALNKVTFDTGGEPLLVAEGLLEWAHPSESLLAVQEQNHEEPTPTPRPTKPLRTEPEPQPPRRPVPYCFFENSSTPADGDLDKYKEFARKTVTAALPVIEKLKRERDAVEAREARAAKRNAGARQQAEHR